MGDVSSKRPARTQKVIDDLTVLLTRNDVAPVWAEFRPRRGEERASITFAFMTPFRAARAAELLPQGLALGATGVLVRTRVVESVERPGDTEIGEGGPASVTPTHGRLARCAGPSGFFKWGSKIIAAGGRALFTTFGGSLAGKGYDAALSAMQQSVNDLDPDQLNAWFNDAPSEDIFLWAIGWAKAGCAKAFSDNRKSTVKILRALGISAESFSTRDSAVTATLKTLLWQSKLNMGIAPCRVEHALQAILILDYGPLAETWPPVKAALDHKPGGDYAKALPPWIDQVLTELGKHRVTVEIGQVNGTAQDTPWTCGPAALRAVLAHHGDDVDEDALAVLAGNVPVLGVRPSGLVKAASELGYYAHAMQLRDVAALAPFLARDLPVMVVVDSFTQPGKAGHWVVVTAVGPDHVRIMDPHTPGNWRTLTPAAFDARWWHREGGRKVRRLALIIVPEEQVTA